MLSVSQLFTSRIQENNKEENNKEEIINKLKNIDDPYLKGGLLAGAGTLAFKHFGDKRKNKNKHHQKSDNVEDLIDMFPHNRLK
jgi:uncharacterized membrane protein YebE (DUF533 family)